MKKGKIIAINGNMITVEFDTAVKQNEVAYVVTKDGRLKSEVVRIKANTAKLKNQNITVDWYKKEFLNPKLPAKDIAINAGLNKKTIHNMFNSSTKEIVIDASTEHYKALYDTIGKLVDAQQDIELTLTIKFKGVSVELNISESLIVINTLAVKRSELRGGLWSAAGKRVEKLLMLTLCKLYGVSEKNYAIEIKGKAGDHIDFTREIDFYLISGNNNYKCEVKLMGRGNPESADAVIARDSKVFIADKLSEINKRQLDSKNIEWVELRSSGGFRKFEAVLKHLGIPNNALPLTIDKEIDAVFNEIFNKKPV
ncbi:type II restriction endonuclease [Candidatus Magnetoovum chiemensis]|nr:type II restriction endonuclease [Candidatus Magnetoovum chiemensis]